MKKLAILGGKPIRKKPFPAYNFIRQEEKEAVERVMNSGILSNYLGSWGKLFYGGPEVQSFEKEWAEYFGVKYAIAVNSCTSGLISAIGAVQIEPGDEVIVSPFSMSASAVAPLFYGGIPIFADIEEKYFCLEPKSIEEKITAKTKAILIADIFGQPYNAEVVNKLAEKYNLAVIEDCAQSPNARYRGRYAGTLGDIGVFSLNFHKHIHTGEGGVVVTDNDELAERVRLIRNHAESIVEGKGVKNLVNMVGFNFRMTEIQAAIGRSQLKKLDQLTNRRIKNAQYLSKKLSEIPGISSAPVRDGTIHVYYVHPFLYDCSKLGIERDKFIKAVKAELSFSRLREEEGVQLAAGYVKPLYLLPLFQNKIAFGSKGYPFNLHPDLSDKTYKKGICPIAERMHEKELFFHEFINPPVTKSDLDDVVKAFRKVYEWRKELE